MVEIGFDTSYLRVLTIDGKVCTSCCATLYNDAACCCFTDPSPDAWSASQTYAKYDCVSHSDGLKYFSKRDGNIGHEPRVMPSSAWWAMYGSCSAGRWEFGPYGGIINVPPKYYMAVAGEMTRVYRATGDTYICRVPSQRFELNRTAGYPDFCFYTGYCTVSTQNWNSITNTWKNDTSEIAVILALRTKEADSDELVYCTGFYTANTGNPPITYVGWLWGPKVSVAGSNFWIPWGHSWLDSIEPHYPSCSIVGTSSKSWEEEMFIWGTGYIDTSYTVNKSWVPADCDYQAWDSAVNYVVDDCVYHGGCFYKCTNGHINKEPPNASYWELVE